MGGTCAHPLGACVCVSVRLCVYVLRSRVSSDCRIAFIRHDFSEKRGGRGGGRERGSLDWLYQFKRCRSVVGHTSMEVGWGEREEKKIDLLGPLFDSPSLSGRGSLS